MNRFLIPPRWTAVAVLAAVLMGGGCCLFTPPHSKYTAIHQLTIDGNTAGVAADLKASPADLNLPDDAGMTPLHLAAIHCHIDTLQLLIAKGADPARKAKGGGTPLHYAAQEGCKDAVVALLKAGAKPDALDDQGRTPLDRAIQWHQAEVVLLLQSH